MKEALPSLPERRDLLYRDGACAARRSFCSALIACMGAGSLTSACVESIPSGTTLVGSEPLELHAEDSGMALSVELVGDAVVRGDNAFVVRCSDAAAALTGVSAVMPGHGHDTSAPSIEPAEDGYRVSGLSLFMPGRWEVTLELDVSGALDRAVFSVDVP